MMNIIKNFTLLIGLMVTLNANNNYMYKDLDYLNLSTTQKEQIKEILLQYRDDYIEYYREKDKAQQDLKEIVMAERFNAEEFEDVLEDIYEEAIELEVEIFKNIHPILTPTQRELFAKRLQEWRVE